MFIDLSEVVKALSIYMIVKTGCRLVDSWAVSYKEAVTAGVVKKGGEAE